MRILASYRGTEKTWDTDKAEVVFGRTREKATEIFDLSPDQKVSRVHGRIWHERGSYWVEDLGSTHGIRLNGQELLVSKRYRIAPDDVVEAGETRLRIDTTCDSVSTSDEVVDLAQKRTNYLQVGTALVPPAMESGSNVAIGANVDADSMNAVKVQGVSEEFAKRLKIVWDLPLKFAGKTDLEFLLREIVDRLSEIIPTAESWALVLRDRKSDRLLLKAYHASGPCSISETLARKAVEKRQAFIWRRSKAGDLQGTLLESPIAAGIYAPLLWQDEVLGVLCADGHKSDMAFNEQDLDLMAMVAQYAAVGVATHELQEKLRQESSDKSNLLQVFSPAVAEHLMKHRGRFQPGGAQRHEVTLLVSDIRGFTRMCWDMQPDAIIETVNEYFSYLVPAILAHKGQIDKFMGDGILAAFGSPEPDPLHHEHAVMAALEMQDAIKTLNSARAARGVPAPTVGIGLHCGEIVQGFVGTSERMEYTVIGDAVNRASRYCAAAQPNEVLISPEVHELVWRLVDAEQVTIGTKHEGDLRAYRVSKKRGQVEQTGTRT